MTTHQATVPRLSAPRLAPSRPLLAIERRFVYRYGWIAFGSGFFEPFTYLVLFGLVLGQFIGNVPGPLGEPVRYANFIAPALVAVTAEKGAVYAATAVFGNLKFGTIYKGMLNTPISPTDIAYGEVAWASFRGFLYAVAFIIIGGVLGVLPWEPMAVPAAALVAFTFAGFGLMITTYLRSYQDFAVVDIVSYAQFLCGAALFPLTIYPHWLAILVEFTPLYQANDLLRTIALGEVGTGQIVNVAYLLALGIVGFVVARRRMDAMLLGRA